MTEEKKAECVLRLFGVPDAAVKEAAGGFSPQWKAEARWKSRGAETLVALSAQNPAGRLRFCQRTANRVSGIGRQMRRRLLLDLCTGLGVGITQRPKVKDPFRPGDGLQPGLQKGPGGSIRTDEESVVPFQFLHGGLGQRGLPGPVQVGGKLLPQHLRGLF